jgi:hypothetical protein
MVSKLADSNGETKMNIYTKDIMQALNIDAETAMRVQDEMCIDFSECSDKAFIKEAKMCFELFVQPTLVSQ